MAAYAFTDPLGAAQADRRPMPVRTRLRLSAAGLHAVAALTLVMSLTTPDPDPSDHLGLAICAGVAAVTAVLLVIWRSMPDRALLAVPPFGTLATCAVVAVAEPVALVPLFFLWPMLLAGYFLQRREVVLNYAVLAVGYGIVSILWVDPVARLVQYNAVLIVLAVVLVLVVALKEHLAALVARLHVLATRDPLTGALNRRAFGRALEDELVRCHRHGHACSLVILDVDHFKAINDRHGHAAGDAALQQLAATIESCTRRTDAFARLGGEEFAVLLVETDGDGAQAFSESLRRAIADASPMTVSIGVASTDAGYATADELLRVADRALYAAKDAGRNRVVRADSAPGSAPAVTAC